MNRFDPYEEMLAHAGMLRQHDRWIRGLLQHDANGKREFLRLQQQVVRLLDHIEQQDQRIEQLEGLIEDLLNDDTE